MSCDVFFLQAEAGIRYWSVTGVQTCALPICLRQRRSPWRVPSRYQGDRARHGDRLWRRHWRLAGRFGGTRRRGGLDWEGVGGGKEGGFGGCPIIKKKKKGNASGITTQNDEID